MYVTAIERTLLHAVHFVVSHCVVSLLSIVMLFTVMKALRNVATEIENVTPQVITAARKVYRDPDSESAQKRMEDLKHKWAGTVSKLASLIDDVTDPRDYIVAAGEQLNATCQWYNSYF